MFAGAIFPLLIDVELMMSRATLCATVQRLLVAPVDEAEDAAAVALPALSASRTNAKPTTDSVFRQ
jgi:hypothetical protein